LTVVSIFLRLDISISCKLFDYILFWLVHDIMGKLQGVKLTKELRSILDIALELPQSGEDKELQQLISDDDKASPSAVASSTSSPRSMSASSPTFLLQQVQDVKRSLLQQPSYNTTDVKSTLNKHKHDDILPLVDIQAIQYLINNSSQTNNKKIQLIQQLETALQATKLSFQPKPQPSTDPAFTKRLERLRLQDEERSYNNLTTNLKTA